MKSYFELFQKAKEKQLNNISIADQSFSGQDLRLIHFAESSFKNVIFTNCDIEQSIFNECIFTNCNFDNADMIDIKFQRVKFINCSFKNTNLSGSLIFESILDGCDLCGANLLLAELDGSTLQNTIADSTSEFHLLDTSKAKVFQVTVK